MIRGLFGLFLGAALANALCDCNGSGFVWNAAPESTAVSQGITVPEPTFSSSQVVCDCCDTNSLSMTTKTQHLYFAEGSVETRTFEITDATCSDTHTFTQQIYIYDTQPPQMQPVLSDVSAACNMIPKPCEPLAYDNVDPEVYVLFSESRVDGSCPFEYTIIRTWNATDSAGNTASESQTVHVSDTSPPVTGDQDSSTTIECDALPAAGTKTYMDNCDKNVEATMTETTVGSSIVREWTATDSCGNAGTPVRQTFVVEDNTPPVIHGVAESTVTIECDASHPAPCEVTVTDNCDDNLVATFSESSDAGTCPNEKTITQTWTATDSSGGTSMKQRVIAIQDTEAPVITGVSANIVLTCAQFVPTPHVGAYDNCDESVTVTESEETISNVCENSFVKVLHFSATDGCGNTAEKSTTITVSDTIAPMLLGTESDVTVECADSVPLPSSLQAYDNCQNGGAIDNLGSNANFSISSQTCDNSFIRTDTWSVTDICGNEATHTRDVTVVDTVSPTFLDLPTDQTVACGSVPSPPPVTVSDNCDDDTVVVPVITTVAGACDGEWTIEYSFSGADACGNAYSDSYTVTVVDTVKPTFDTPPTDLSLTCLFNEQSDISASTGANDSCDGQLVGYRNVSLVSDDCTHSKVYTVTWYADDSCGNRVEHIQTVSVTDTEIPVISCSDTTHQVEYTVADEMPVFPSMSASDNCDGSSLQAAPNMVLQTGNACNRDYKVEYNLQDSCGNAATTCTHTYQVRDTIPPTITAPSDDVMECAFAETNIEAYVNANHLGNVVHTGNNVSVSFVATSIHTDAQRCANEDQWEITYSAFDECGNSATDTQTITVSDTVKPEFSDPPTSYVRVDCVHLPHGYGANLGVTDNCDADTSVASTNVAYTEDASDFVSGTIYTWTHTDACGNSDSFAQTVVVYDDSVPTLTCPSDRTAQCSTDFLPSEDAPVTQTDNCGFTLAGAVDVPSALGCGHSQVVRTFTATDTAGNTASCSFTVTAQDTEAPTCSVTPGSSRQVECDGNGAGQTWGTDTITCSDNCGGVVDYKFSSQASGTTPDFIMTHSWQPEDSCGNKMSQITQVISIKDSSAPTFPTENMPNDSYQCTKQAPSVYEAEDDCNLGVTTSYGLSEDAAPVCAPFTYTRTWSATNEHGLSTTTTQSVSVTGSNALSWESSPWVTDSAEYGSTPADFETLDAVSDCTNITPICDTAVETPGSCSTEKTVARTCSATSCAGSISYTQTMSIVDTTAPNPAAETIPSTVAISCEAYGVLDLAELQTTSCDALTTADASISDCSCSFGPQSCTTCGGCFDVTYTCTFEDDCGNSNTASSEYQVYDATVPDLVPSQSADETVACDHTLGAFSATATDNCDAAINAVAEPPVYSSGSAAMTSATRTATIDFKATDLCGNTNSITRTITFVDLQAPEACTDGSTTVEAGEFSDSVFPASRPTSTTATVPTYCNPAACAVTDNCDSAPEMSCVVYRVDGTCPHEWTEVVEFTFTDDAGHTDVSTFSMVIQDTKAPDFTNPGAYADLTVSVDSIPEPTSPAAVDANFASESATITKDQEYTIDESAGGTTFKIVYEWSATDTCGNSAPATQTVTVTDTEATNISGVPADVLQECTVEVASADEVSLVVAHWADNGSTLVASDDVVTYSNVDQVTCDDSTSQVLLQIVREFTSTDLGGNVQSDTYTITIKDSSAPVFDVPSVPAASRTVEGCDSLAALNAYAAPTATDACATHGLVDYVYYSSGAATVTVSNATLVQPNGDSTVTYTWTAADNCGNSQTTSQIVSIVDTTDPSFVEALPEDQTIDGTCTYTVPTLTADDNCDGSIPVDVHTVTTASACAEAIDLVTTWTATDSRGNTITTRQTVVFVDTVKPSLVSGVPDEYLDKCQDTKSTAKPTFSDACDSDVTVSDPACSSTGANSEECTFTAQDSCGNEETFTKTVNWHDSSAPTIDDASLLDTQTITCRSNPTDMTATFTDDCSDDLSVVPSVATAAGSCDDAYSKIFSWTVSDSNSSHTNTYSGTVIVTDDGLPEFDSIPTDSTNSDCTAPALGDLSWTDCQASGSTSASPAETLPLIGNEFKHVISWSQDDNCGNTATASTTVTHVDTTAPVISCSNCDDRAWSCDDKTNVPACTCTATDNWDDCFAATAVQYEEQFISDGNCAGTELLVRTFHYSDAAGNDAINVTQTVSFVDLAAPTFDSTPAHASYECSAPAAPQVTASDNCDADPEVVLTTSKEDSPPLTYPFTLTHSWTATDACGTSSTIQQIVSVTDTTGPTFTSPLSDVTYECQGSPPPSEPDVLATVTDNCDLSQDDNSNMDTLVRTDVVVTNTVCLRVTEYTYTATDEAGNVSTDKLTITVEDTTPPEIVEHAVHVTSECTEPSQPTFTCSDCNSCTVGSASRTDIVAQDAVTGCHQYEYELEWTATDECGLSSSVQQTVTIEDNSAPVLTCVSGCDITTMEACGASPSQPTVTALDNCDGQVTVDTTSSTSGNDDACSGYHHIYTSVATDSCGNSETHVHTITVTDNGAWPWKDGSAPIATDTVTCDNYGSYSWAQHQVTNCFYGSNTHIDAALSVEPGAAACTSQFVMNGVYSVTDQCGRVTSATTVLSVTDSAAPVMTWDSSTTAPTDISSECSSPVAVPAFAAVDNCQTATITATATTATVAGSCNDEWKEIRSWTAVDDCGNSDSAVQTISYSDSAPPVQDTTGNCVDEQVECDETIPSCTATSDDACDAHPTTTPNEETLAYLDASNIAIQYDLARTYSSCDDCGNCATQSHTISVRDTQAPVVTIDADITAEVDAVPNPYDGQSSAVDNCNGAVSPVNTRNKDIQIPGECVFNTYDIRIATATDSSGNTASESQTVTVRDTTPPEIHNVPTNVTLEYGSYPTLSESVERLDIRDNSGGSVTVTESETSAATAEGGQLIVRTVTATDECSNSHIESWSILIEDTTPPIFNQLPESKEVSCDAVPTACTLHTVGETLAVTFSEVIHGNTRNRTWSATDPAGNEVTHTQILTVVDDSAPVLSRTPEHVVVSCSCDTFPSAALVAALDNCDTDVPVVFGENVAVQASPDDYLLLRTWTATDDDSNSVTWTQSITVEDTEAPILYPKPAHVDVECNAVPSAPTVRAIDNCDETAVAVLSVSTTAGACDNQYTILNSWTTQDRSGQQSSYVQTVAVDDTNAPEIFQDGSHCVFPADSAKTATFTVAELFQVQDNCAGSISISAANCTATGSQPSDCDIVSTPGSVLMVAHPGFSYNVFVSASDACGNAVTAKAVVVVPNDEAEQAALGLYNCRAPA